MRQGQMVFRLLIVSALAVSAGCATLSKDECLNADWYSIGFEDGVKGRPASWQGRHRQACAEYSVSVNVDRYMQGREKGLQRYCVAKNGYWVGKSGNRYNGVCSPQQEPAFLDAYRYGRDIYKLVRRRDKFIQHVKTIRYDLEQYKTRILKKESRLVKETLTEKQKRALLKKIRLLQLEKENASIELQRLIYELGLMDAELAQMERDNPYIHSNGY